MKPFALLLELNDDESFEELLNGASSMDSMVVLIELSCIVGEEVVVVNYDQLDYDD